MQEEVAGEAVKSPSLEMFKTQFDKGQEQADHSWPCFDMWVDQTTSFTTQVILNVSSHEMVLPLPL